MYRPNILIFAHDGRGLGHLRRLSAFAKELQQRASVLFVTGQREASWLVPAECEFIRLPSLDAIDERRSQYWGRSCSMNLRTGLLLRNDLLETVVQTFTPDALITDYLPLGMGEELAHILESLPNCKKFYVHRGILGDKWYVRTSVLTPKALHALREQYDRILVTSDPKIVDVVKEYGLNPSIAKKVTYVGYAVSQTTPAERSAARLRRGLSSGATWVVCSAGSGKESENFVNRCWWLSQRFPECWFDIIAGPRSALSITGMAGSDARVRVFQEQTSELPLWHAAADVVIGRAGYNTLLETAQGQAAMLVVPIPGDTEQSEHARRLSAYRDLHIVDDLTSLPLLLERHLAGRTGAPRNAMSCLASRGAENGANTILKDLIGNDGQFAKIDTLLEMRSAQ